MEISFQEGDAVWTEMRERGKSDLYYMAGVICKYGDVVGMTEGMHKIMCKVVEKKTGVPELDTCPQRLVLMPRGSGKSTIISQAYVVQRIVQDPNIAILICNEKLENAQSFLAAIKHTFEQNELFRALYPEVIHPDIKAANVKWNDTEINVPRTTGRKEFTVKCQGVGAALASMHPDLILVDDMVSREAAENARRGDGQLTGAINRWVNQLIPLLNQGYQPFPEIIVLGTRWYRGDPYEHVEVAFGYGMPRKTWHLGLKLANGDIQSLPVHRAGDLVIFSRQVIENGRAAWPERPGYDLESLAKFRLRDPALYAANMMNDPSDEITATFKESWLQFYDWSGEQSLTWVDAQAKTRNVFLADLDLLVLVDPGGFGRAKGSDRSRGAILVTGSTSGENPEHLVLDAFSDKVPYTVVAEKILALATRYPPRRVFIEEVGQQAAFYDLVVQTAKKRGLNLAFDKLTPKNRDKDARILGLEPYFQRGMIRFGKGPQFHELREQYRAWPTPRADLLDVLAYGPEVWRQQRVSRQGVEARQRMEKEAVLARMGVALRR